MCSSPSKTSLQKQPSNVKIRSIFVLCGFLCYLKLAWPTNWRLSSCRCHPSAWLHTITSPKYQLIHHLTVGLTFQNDSLTTLSLPHIRITLPMTQWCWVLADQIGMRCLAIIPRWGRGEDKRSRRNERQKEKWRSAQLGRT